MLRGQSSIPRDGERLVEATSKPTQAKANMSLLFVRWNGWLMSRSSGAIHLGEPIRVVNWATVVSAKLASPKSATLAFHSWSTSMFAWQSNHRNVYRNADQNSLPLASRHGISHSSEDAEYPLQSEATTTRD
jgi:hypothetical protein